ncbi:MULTISPECIES: phosphate ABC transporter permease PstA [unclassified Prochlorococcus]|uniref:phosphate ABC transporter permease PstA n=1 Tax=unclassified Prochlorococcus TaxID=2627481 RepID=UPI000533A7F4|nr:MULTISPECIES: phosphate ABC transporter permease PstA [unclassified Prochlorococcus]KGG15259.1 Phosphate transport system permease protein PstA [Prochlorococcus sp. MIT 0602]KGG17536.1 Phosphate transport system permease protein PstA [Prochlorococcus sp. MIT 0603]
MKEINNKTFVKTQSLRYRAYSYRSITNKLLTYCSIIFTLISLVPLVLVLLYVLVKGSSAISLDILFLEPQPPGGDFSSAGGIGNAIVGTVIVTSIACLFSIPIGVGTGIYLAEYSNNLNVFSRFIRFGTNVLAGVPSIIAGVFIYAIIVVTKVLFGSTFSALAGAMALSILMLPIIIKTTDEGLKLVPDDLRRGALGIGASKKTTILEITLPAARKNILTGILLSIARASGETAPLIFTALFSYYHISSINDIFFEISSLSVLIYNFALEPYAAQNQLAWAASCVLLIMILFINIIAKMISRTTYKL